MDGEIIPQLEKYVKLAQKQQMVHVRLITPGEICFDIRAILKCRWGWEDYFEDVQNRYGFVLID